jgi:hypothetical protein
MIGIALRTPEGEMRALATRDFFIGVDAVMAAKEARFETLGQSEALTGGVPAHDDTENSRAVESLAEAIQSR